MQCSFQTGLKTIVNRFKAILPYIINPSQSAFIPGCQIVENDLLAFKKFHYMKNKKSGRKCDMALKLDMSKAYDRVEWGFLETFMFKLGFHEK